MVCTPIQAKHGSSTGGWTESHLHLQEYRLMLSGVGINNQGAFTGEATFDVAQYAFKGAKEQRLSLSIPIHYQRNLDGESTPTIATVEAQIISKPAQEVGLWGVLCSNRKFM